MTNKPKIKGTKWETDCVKYLSRWWPRIKRAALQGTGDVGDLTHPEGWAVECKNVNPISLPRFLREAEAEAQNKGVENFVALIKNRRGKDETGKVEDGYAVTRTRVWGRVAFEHEWSMATAEHIGALLNRLNDGAITESDFVTLVKERLIWHSDALTMWPMRAMKLDE